MKLSTNSSVPWLFAPVLFLFLLSGISLYGRAQAQRDSAPIPYHPPKSNRVVRIPFEISGGGHIFLRVRVNDSGPLWFGLDSGAESTLIRKEQAAAFPVVHFSQALRGDDASNIGAGFIGGKLLRRFKLVIFDQQRHRIILEQ